MVHGSTRKLRRVSTPGKNGTHLLPAGFENGLNSQQLRFVYFYSLLGNGTQAALYAGYAPAGAGERACKLLEVPSIQQAIEAQHVDREADAKITYAGFIRLTQVAIDHMEALRAGGATPEDMSRAIEVAGRALERIARCQGLLVASQPDRGDVERFKTTLQDMVRRARESKVTEQQTLSQKVVGA